MNCPNCKKEIANDSKFCEFCGSNASVNKGYKEVIDQILKEKKNPENEKNIQSGAKRKKLLKNSVLILSVFITITFFLEATYDLEGAGLLLAIPMTIVAIFAYSKIAKKFNL